MSARRVTVLGLLGVVALAAFLAWSARADTSGGGPIPHQLDGETYPGPRTQITGRYDLAENGCMFVVSDGVSRMAVWPRDATQSKDNGSVVELSDGTRIHPSDTIAGAATVFPVANLTGFPDGYWGSRVLYCAPQAKDVLVLDSVAVAAR